MQPHLFSNFEIQKHYQIKRKFNGAFSRNNLPKIKHGTFETNLDNYKSTRTHGIALHVNDDNVTYFDSFGVEHIA